MRVFWDVNVLLDLVDRDRPDHSDAEALLRWSASRPVMHLCAWHTLSILDYVCGRKFGKEATESLIHEILELFTIPATGTTEAQAALRYLDGDYEDAMQIAAAATGLADCIVSRDSAGFSKSPIPVVSLEEFLASYGSSDPPE
jgi:predicted nucleic acid-binding protein